MAKLLGIRTVYDIDPTKTFRIADILEAGAILPHSVPLSEVMLEDLKQPEQCRCLEYAGDDPKCPVHGWEKEQEGSDTSTMTQLNYSGFGCSSSWWNSIEEIPF